MLRIKRFAMTCLLVVAINATVALSLSELMLRLIGYSHATFYSYDSERGWALRPHARGLWTDEGRNNVEISADGLHDREHVLTKPANSYRVAVLGDSFTEAIQLPISQNFSSMAGEALKSCPLMWGHDPETINFGVAGYGTAQELLTLRTQVWRYSPDVVALAFFTGNDLEDNDPALLSDHALAGYRPYFRIQSNKLELAKPWGKLSLLPLMIWLSGHSRVFQLSNWARHRYFGRWRPTWQTQLNVVITRWSARRPSDSTLANQPILAESPPVQECHSAGLPLPSLDPITNPELDRAWDITERLILEMRDEVMARRAKFLLLIIGPDIEAYPDERTRIWFMNRCKVKDLSYAENRLLDFAHQNNIETLSLTPRFEAYGREHHAFLYGFGQGAERGFGHWNADGHRLAGRLLAEKLCTMEGGRARTATSATAGEKLANGKYLGPPMESLDH